MANGNLSKRRGLLSSLTDEDLQNISTVVLEKTAEMVEEAAEKVEDKSTAQLGYYGNQLIYPSDISLFAFTDIGDAYSVQAAFDKADASVTNIIVPYEYSGMPVTDIEAEGFKDCVHLEKVVLPGTVEYINESAFEGCTSLSYIASCRPNGVSVETYAFRNCTSLTDISKLRMSGYGEYMFEGSAVEILDLCEFYKLYTSDRYREEISVYNNSFSNMSKLKWVYIPREVTEIYENAFLGCERLNMVFYEGSLAEWKNIVIESGNEILDDAEIICKIKADIEKPVQDSTSLITSGAVFNAIGDIEATLDQIIAVQNSLIGGDDE